MSKILITALLASFGAALPCAAHADPTTTFYISDGTTADGGAFSGYFVLDTANDVVQSGSVTIDDPSVSFSTTASVDEITSLPGLVFASLQGGDGALYLFLTTSVTAPLFCATPSSLPDCVNYGDRSVVDLNGSRTIDDATSATISTSPIAPTPEPSALLLFGTGALGLCGAMRRKLSAV